MHSFQHCNPFISSLTLKIYIYLLFYNSTFYHSFYHSFSLRLFLFPSTIPFSFSYSSSLLSFLFLQLLLFPWHSFQHCNHFKLCPLTRSEKYIIFPFCNSFTFYYSFSLPLFLSLQLFLFPLPFLFPPTIPPPSSFPFLRAIPLPFFAVCIQFS